MRTQMRIGVWVWLVVATIVELAPVANAWVTNVLATYDSGPYDENGDGVATKNRTGTGYYVGDYDVSATNLEKGFVIFRLPSLSVTETVRQATFRVYHLANYAVETNAALYHLRDFNLDAEGWAQTSFNTTPAFLVDGNFLNTNGGYNNASVNTQVSADVTAFVNNDYDYDPVATQRCAFRLELYNYPAAGNGNNTANRYLVGTMERATDSERPYLILDIEPRPTVTINVAPLWDRGIQDTSNNGAEGGDALRNVAHTYCYVGDFEAAGDTGESLERGVFQFQLPAIPDGYLFRSARVAFYLESVAGTPSTNCSLMHLQDMNATAAAVSYYQWPGATTVNSAFLLPGSAPGLYTNDVTACVGADYANDAGATKYSAFRLQQTGTPFPSGANGNGAIDRYLIRLGSYATVSQRPKLILTYGLPVGTCVLLK